MCGICGFTGLRSDLDVPSTIEAMNVSLAHRGPDGRATWVDAGRRAAIGHTRLAIIDLEGGAQPMSTIDGRYVVVFNGELYNFQNLHSELQRLGCVFRTRSDTEVLLNAYATWGLDALRRLEGMFAFAVYDTHEGSLVMARDRTGIKPLYYCNGPAGFFFGSEIKSLLQVAQIPRRVDYEALADYLVLGYPLIPKTLFRDVREMPPGSWLKFMRGSLEGSRYWRWSRREEYFEKKEALVAAEEALLAALQSHLIADVPVGAFLSGGVDSSLLVSLLARKLKVDITAFTARFDEAEYDESPHARIVAKHLGVRHRELVIPSSAGSRDEIDLVLDQFDQPFADSSAIPTYMITREMRRHVKVAIAGDGGDEMFGGYPRFHYADVANRLGGLPAWVLSGATVANSMLARLAPCFARKANRMLAAARAQGGNRFLNLSCYVYPDALARSLSGNARDLLHDYIPVVDVDSSGDRAFGGPQMIDATVRHALPGDYLRKVDMMSSAHGLEVRVPYLADGVLDFASRLSNRLKYKGSQLGKILLRELLGRYVPTCVFDRPKWGFGIPLDKYLPFEQRRAIQDQLTRPSARLTDFVNLSQFMPIIQIFVRGGSVPPQWSRFMVYQQTYLLMSLERWLQRWNPSA